MKNRLALIEHFKNIGFKRGAEVGVFDGRFSKIMVDTIPDLELYSVDNWVRAWVIGKLPAYQKLIHQPKVKIVALDSVDASTLFEDEFFDFVYIDANHSYEMVKRDLEAWYPKVRKGGIFCGDDYYNMPSGNRGVIDAVDEFAKNLGVELLTTDWDNGNPVKDDRQPNWYFIKV